jgi:aspartate ammonia-lyase
MNCNEVIANLANQKLGKPFGTYHPIHPLEQVNLHQSTNDVYPTATKVAVLFLLKDLEKEISWLQEELQAKEKQFADVLKLGRTELMDAVPMTLGMEFGAYAEAVARDRWRIFKCRERIKVVNLGGTAIGTGLGAPRDYIFKVTDTLRSLTGLSISRCENLVDATQNLDPFVEISGMLKTYACNLLTISNDLLLLNMGPNGGIAEITIPARQTGSTIMPGKINPVILEAVGQVALRVIANDSLITHAAGLGQLELNQYFPLVNFTILETLELLKNMTVSLRDLCITGIEANVEHCRDLVLQSHTLATFFVPAFGYQKVEELLYAAIAQNMSFRQILLDKKLFTEEELEQLLAPQRMYKLGFTDTDYK